MQIILNKMVISVRQGFLGPEDASRTIHECASLLNLQLTADLPVTCIILSGMRKTATANDVTRAFRRFGDIADAAVASNERGFGKFFFVTVGLCISFVFAWRFLHWAMHLFCNVFLILSMYSHY